MAELEHNWSTWITPSLMLLLLAAVVSLQNALENGKR
jgi:hypothetical protein